MKPIAFWAGTVAFLQGGVASASQGPGVSTGTADPMLQHVMAVLILIFPIVLAGVALARRRASRGL